MKAAETSARFDQQVAHSCCGQFCGQVGGVSSKSLIGKKFLLLIKINALSA